ncbi:MAG: hypothetical protein ACRD6W_08445, partial [Nitrososphaerales archaeon]
PLDRDPRRVLADLISGVVTPGHAAERYGVIVDYDAERVDEGATHARRREIREERRATSSAPDLTQHAAAAGAT